MAKRRSRRLRKKLRLREFRELGFSWKAVFKQPLSADRAEAFVDALLCEVIESQGLSLGGWATGGFVANAGRGSVTEGQRKGVLDWLEGRDDVEEVKASQLVDAWDYLEEDGAP